VSAPTMDDVSYNDSLADLSSLSSVDLHSFPGPYE